MGSTHNLIELLKSQIAVYNDIRAILVDEKNALVNWKFSETNELTKRKEKAIYKNKILEDARLSLASRIKDELGATDTTLASIIEACTDIDSKEELIELRDTLVEIANEVNLENMALKSLYSTNLRIANEFNALLDSSSSTGYNKTVKPTLPSTLHTIG